MSREFVSARRPPGLGACKIPESAPEIALPQSQKPELYQVFTAWRREWDSNPRYGFPYTRFPSVRLQPLGHPSGAGECGQYSHRASPDNPTENLRIAVTPSRGYCDLARPAAAALLEARNLLSALRLERRTPGAAG